MANTIYNPTSSRQSIQTEKAEAEVQKLAGGQKQTKQDQTTRGWKDIWQRVGANGLICEAQCWL